jgi:translation initiation factor IF-3
MALKEKRGNEPRVNREIVADKIRLIGADGEMVGISTVTEGLRLAAAASMDLVEIVPGAEPPVCKILDYGKYRFAEQKKMHEQRKKQKVQQLKEIKIRPGIGAHDLEIKVRHIHKFLDEGDKVKLTLRFRGREMAHMELGMAVLHKVRDALADRIKVEHEPKLEGRQVMMVVAPAKH